MSRLNSTETPDLSSRWVLRFVAFLIGTLLPGLVGPPVAEAGDDAPPPVLGTVYVFRSMGGRLASPEMDKLASRIAARGLETEVHNYADWIGPANAAIARYKKETWKSAIIALGHSAGGDSAIRFALWLKRAAVPVNLIITLDPTRIANRVPGNVQRFINIHSSDNALGGGDPKPARDFKGHLASVDLKNYAHEWHLSLPATQGLQDAVVDTIASAAEQPEAGEGTGEQIAYAMPRDEPIALFDSGVAIAAEPGETPTTIAERYGVPVWIVAAVNNIEPARRLPGGQRIVVPLRLGMPQPNP